MSVNLAKKLSALLSVADNPTNTEDHDNGGDEHTSSDANKYGNMTAT